jgi:hypothetical protein
LVANVAANEKAPEVMTHPEGRSEPRTSPEATMNHLSDPAPEVKSSAIAVPIVAIPADDFDVRPDADWEAMYEASIASDRVCTGPIF